MFGADPTPEVDRFRNEFATNLFLKLGLKRDDIAGVKIDRLELETISNKVDLRLHPRLTLVTGLGPDERQALGTEILDSLRQGHPGLSVDVVEADGRLIELYRPLEGSPTVRDAVTGDDLTDQFLQNDTVDLLSAIALPPSEQDVPTFELLRIQNSPHNGEIQKPQTTAPIVKTAEEAFSDATQTSSTTSFSSKIINQLASLDQGVLWATAMVLAETEVEVDANATPTPEDPGHPYPDALNELVEDRHAAVKVASALLEKDRVLHLTLAGTLGVIGLVGAIFVSKPLGFLFLLAAIVAGTITARRWHHLTQASEAEVEALEAAGLTCYLKLRMSELGGMPSEKTPEDELREIHSLATQAWIDLVGPNTSLEWAVTNRKEIQLAAESLAAGNPAASQDSPVGQATDPMAGQSSADARPTADDGLYVFLPWLHRHLERVANAYQQCVPIVIDHCFTSSDSLTSQDINMVVELLSLHSSKLQLIVMTDNPEILNRFPATSEEASILRLGRGVQAQEVELVESSS